MTGRTWARPVGVVPPRRPLASAITRRAGLCIDEHTAPRDWRTWADIAWSAHAYAIRFRLDELRAVGDALAVGLPPLVVLGVGLDARGWSMWPMYNADGRVCGVRTRDPRSGAKRAVPGSQSGYFAAAAPMLGTGPLLVVEGASDTAAALALGFDVVGRASANPGAHADAGALALCCGRDVVVVPDRDPAGVAGARNFTARVLRIARLVRWMPAPRSAKDLRAALVAGLTRDELHAAIAAANSIRAAVEVRP